MGTEWLIIGIACAVGAAFLLGRHMGASLAIRTYERLRAAEKRDAD